MNFGISPWVPIVFEAVELVLQLTGFVVAVLVVVWLACKWRGV